MASLSQGGSGGDCLLLWSVEEALERSVLQIGVSACGATALINALAALNVRDIPSIEQADAAVGTRLGRPGAGLADYLASRSCAGATHRDLILSCERLPEANVSARFGRYSDIIGSGVPFLEWCHEEMRCGGVLILCMNLQRQLDRAGNEWIPDAWHHQMVFGVDLRQRLLLLTNPLCAMTEAELRLVLDSPSELLVRDCDVAQQALTGPAATAAQISGLSPRWQALDVGAKAMEMAAAFDASLSAHNYLCIPAAYETGATVLRKRSALMQFMRGKGDAYGDVQLHYTSHINWAWVVESVIGAGSWELGVPVRLHQASRDMPTRAATGRCKPQYALFRVEVVCALPSPSPATIYSAWATSQAMEFLDPKDALFRCLQSRGSAAAMPPTFLVPWDCASMEQLQLPEALIPSKSHPCMLKAALGSGGYGLYFVTAVEDIVTIAKNHAEKAKSVPNFVENLKRDYGDVPSWSVQHLVPSIRLNDGRKCQFRSYVVIAGRSLFVYRTIEARIVCWDAAVEGSDVLREDEAVFCADTRARPYNHGRMKVHTERILIDEIAHLVVGGDALRECTVDAFRSMCPDIQARMEPAGDAGTGTMRMAVAGVDLLLTADYKACIVEINNNPAMPGEAKSMSKLYCQHLKDLVSDILKLGLSGSAAGTKFTAIW